MDLKLTNFLCWAKKSVTFNTGLTLLDGRSGKGKSSLLEAVRFAITGVGSGTKLIMKGARSCTVELTIHDTDIYIKRCKNPSNLVVMFKGVEYRNVPAQAIIDKYYGTFGYGAYMKQKGVGTFLSETSAKKRAFLEQLIFTKGMDIPSHKSAYKETRIKELKRKVGFCEGALNQINKNEVAQPEPVPKTLYTPDDIFKAIEDEEKHYKELARQKMQYQQWQLHNAKLHEKIVYVQESIQAAVDEHEQEFKDYDSSKGLHIPEQIKEYREKIDLIKNFTTNTASLEQKRTVLLTLSAEYMEESKLVESEIDHETDTTILKPLKNRLHEISESKNRQKVLADATETLNNLISTSPKDPDDAEDLDCTLQKITEEIAETEKLLTKAKTEEKVLACPSCSAKLLIIFNESPTLEAYTDALIGTRVPEIEKCLKNLKSSRVKVLKRAKQHKKQLLEYTTHQKKIDAARTRLESFMESPFVSRDSDDTIISQIDHLEELMQKNIKLESKLETLEKGYRKQKLKLEKSIASLEKSVSVKAPDETIEELSQRIEELSIIARDNSTLKKKHLRSKKNIKTLKKELKELVNSDTDPVDEFTADDEMKNIEYHEIPALREKLIKATAYKKYTSLNETYKKWQEQKNSAQTELDDTTESLRIAEKFLEIFTQSVSMAINNLLDRINLLLNKYINVFFDDSSISVQITVEDKKNSRSNLNVEILQNGDVFGLDQLSGGERDRVELAFILTINEICKLPFLMLDESLSSLDSVTVENIMMNLNEVSKNKAMVIVLHQAVKGVFQHMIEV